MQEQLPLERGVRICGRTTCRQQGQKRKGRRLSLSRFVGSPNEGLMLEKFVKNYRPFERLPWKKFTENYSPWEDPHAGSEEECEPSFPWGRCSRENIMKSSTAPIPRPLVLLMRKKAEKIRSKIKPGKKGGVRGRYLKIAGFFLRTLFWCDL